MNAATERNLTRPAIRVERIVQKSLVYAGLVFGAILIAFPLYWLLRSSVMAEGDLFIWPPPFLPHPVAWHNYVDIFEIDYIPLPTFFRNSTVLAVTAMIGDVVSTSLVGFSFARLRWSGRDVLFAVLVATLFVPSQVTIIPLFIIFKNVGWLNTLYPLIVPSWFGHAFLIFLMRQFIMTIPFELDDAARIDGCGNLRIYWNIIVPLSKPALATVAIFSFQDKWNQFFEPLIYINKVETFPLSLGVSMFSSALMSPGGGVSGNVSWSHLLAATVVMVLPIVVLFFFAQRVFVQGIVISGVKG